MITSPFDALHNSLANALIKDLSDITYTVKTYPKGINGERLEPFFQSRTRRPNISDVLVDMFVQTWSDTTLGFGGVGGQAFSSAYTVVIHCQETMEYAVYHGGSFSYLIENGEGEGFKKFLEDLSNRSLVGAKEKLKYCDF